LSIKVYIPLLNMSTCRIRG